LDQKNEIFPSMLSQPFAENAILHGLMHAEIEDKILLINAMKTTDGFLFIIEDNGIGRKKSELINSQQRRGHNSFATKAIQERCEMINQSGLLTIEIDFVDLEQGTRVEIHIKNLKKNESNFG
jgi:LytS/YehU family sensor histidine kinase